MKRILRYWKTYCSPLHSTTTSTKQAEYTVTDFGNAPFHKNVSRVLQSDWKPNLFVTLPRISSPPIKLTEKDKPEFWINSAMAESNSSFTAMSLNTTQSPTGTNENGALPFNIGPAGLASGIVLAVLSPVTVIANSLLLWAIYKDPFRMFRTPTACFLIGLAITDLITGLVPEPLVASCYFLDYYKHRASVHCPRIFPVAGVVASITSNSTFLLVLVFTAVQYVAVAFPIKFKRLITMKRTVLCVLVIWVYMTLFELLPLLGVSREMIETVDLYLHSTTTIFLSILLYAMLHRTFCRQMRIHSPSNGTTTTTTTTIQSGRTSPPRRTRRSHVERKFVKINLLLIVIFVVCSLPSAILWYIYLYWPEMYDNSSLFLARVIVDNTLYLKFVLDPFVYAWRLPRYRQALVKAISCESQFS